MFLPFTIAALLVYFIHKKVINAKIRYISYTLVTLFTLFFGSAWVIAMSSPNKSTEQSSQIEKTVEVDHNIPQETKPVEPSPSPSIFNAQTAPNNPNRILAKVVAVIDGDTIDVDLGEGNIQRVRYIGIDTPESVDPRQPIQCFSKEATAKNNELVANGIVGLEKDVSETDRYGRLLRYVYMGDLFINQVLVSEGYASTVSYPPDIKYQEQFRQAEREARTQNRGLWSTCNTVTPTKYNTVPSNTPSVQNNTNNSVTTNNVNTSSGTCKYSCTGSDRDCSDFSSHEEAQVFFNCCGYTADNDPMRLDAVGVGDGIACENI